MESLRRCPKCSESKPLSAYGSRANRMPRKNCLECEGFRCDRCGELRTPSEIPWERRRMTGGSVCITCDPSSKGRRTHREYRPGATYRCRGGCDKTLTGDYYDLRRLPATGKVTVGRQCRSCKREAKSAAKFGADAAEAQLRGDVMYDFDLVRNMFGMTYGEALAWLLRGYQGKVSESRLRDWGITETRKEIWRPDDNTD